MRRATLGKGSHGSGGFLVAGARSLHISEHEIEQWTPVRKKSFAVLNMPCTEMVLGALAMVSFVLAFLEADYVHTQVPDWLRVANSVVLGVYTVEVIVKLYVMRLGFFCGIFNVIDFTVIVVDLVLFMIDIWNEVDSLPSMSFLRIFRLMRLFRGLKVIMGFPQLALMVKCFVCAISATIYGVFMLFMLLTAFSVCAVHFIHPVNMRVSSTGLYDGCLRCEGAFATTSNALITLIQTIIAGDSWGQVTIPIIEEAPWTSVFFCLVYVCVNFVVINVIMSVIVDSALRASKEDIADIVKAKSVEFNNMEKRLKVLCRSMDSDGSGDLTEQELMESYEEIEEFQQLLQSMDVQKEDMHVVFSILDADRSGSVSYDEFIKELFKMKSHDSHTLLMFIRHHVIELGWKVKESERKRERFEALFTGPPESDPSGGAVRSIPVKEVDGCTVASELQEKDLSLQMTSQAQSLKDLGEELRTLRRGISEDLMRCMKDISTKSDNHRLLFSSVTDNLLVLPGGGRNDAESVLYEVTGRDKGRQPFATVGGTVAHCGPSSPGDLQQRPLATSSPVRVPTSAWGVRSGCCAVQRAEPGAAIPNGDGGPAAAWRGG